jgi:tetratricopeptide (TPR) repeat protein
MHAQISSIPDSQSQTGLGGINSIVGTVFGPSGRPIERRVRIVISTMARGNRSTVTGDNGSFAFRGLPSGSYTISIEKEPEFKPFSTSVDIIQFRGAPAQTYTLNIRLEPKPSEAAKPGIINSEFADIPKPAMDLFNKAQEAVAKKDYLGAIELLKLALAEHPTFMLAYNEIGVNYIRLNDLVKADEALSAALKIAPDAFAALLNRGIVLFTAKRYSDAATVLRTAVKKEPENPVAHYFLGQALANLGQFDEAEKELVFALTRGGEELKEAHRILAIIYASRGDKKRAISSIEAYLKLTPNAPDADKLRAALQQWRTDLGESSKSTQKPN